MSSTNNSTTAVFEAFLEASRALDELPKVRAELDRATTEAKTNADLYLNESEAHSAALAEIASLRATLAQREAELSSATFRADRAFAALDNIRGVLSGDVADNGCGVDTGLTPVVEITVDVGSEVQPEVQSEPNPEPAPCLIHNPSAPMDTLQSSPVPMYGADSLTNASTSPIATNIEPSDLDLSTTESSMLTGTTHIPDATAADDESTSGTAADPRPYTNVAYWDKPFDMTWSEFAKLGGTVPYWISDHAAA